MDAGKDPDERRSGYFIVLVGPDGVGKTEVARELLRRRCGRYFHFRPPLRPSDLLETPPSDAQPKTNHTGRFPLGVLRLVRSFALFWCGYLASVVPTIRDGVDVIGDRWAYGYLVQPDALRFSGPQWLADLAIRALPQPDVVVNLTATPETVIGRKPELTPDQIDRELEAWSTLPVKRLVSVDAEPPVDVVVDRLVEDVLV